MKEGGRREEVGGMERVAVGSGRAIAKMNRGKVGKDGVKASGTAGGRERVVVKEMGMTAGNGLTDATNDGMRWWYEDLREIQNGTKLKRWWRR